MSTSPQQRRRGRFAVSAAAIAAVLLAGCGEKSKDNSNGGNATSKGPAKPSASSGGAVDSALAAKVPADVKKDGQILVGTDASYAPSEFLAADGKTIQGFDVDLFTAVAQILGMRVKFQNADFGTIVAGVGSGKYEVGVSSFTVNADREKQAEMVSYFNAGTQWAAKKGNPSGISPDNACGKHVAVQKDTVQVPDVQKRSKTCTSGGKKGIAIEQYVRQDAATAAVVSGKDDAMLADSPVVAYAVKQSNGALQALGGIYDAAPYGYVIKKGETAFAQAVADAVKKLIDNGTYKQILTKWGVDQGAITSPAVNPPAQ